MNVHCCSGQRPSLLTIASAVSCVCFLVHLPLLYVINDGRDYTELVGIQQMLAHCVMIVTFLVHSIRLSCGKPSRPAVARTFVCRCVLFALHLYNALVSVIAQSPDLPYRDVHGERVINLILLVLSLVAAGFQYLAIHSLYVVATAEKGRHAIGLLWQDSAVAYGLLIGVLFETNAYRMCLKESLIPFVLAVALICCIPPIVWNLMGRRHAKTELVLTTLTVFSTAIPGIQALIVCGGGRSQSATASPFRLPLTVYVTTMFLVGRHLVYHLRYADVSQLR